MASKSTNRGAALLAVLWLAAGLSAIALTIANTVRGETERSSTDADGLKAYYLAAGAIDRMLLYLELPTASQKSGGSRKRGSVDQPVTAGKPNSASIQESTRLLALDFPTGAVVGELIPETSKLDVNKATPRDLLNLLVALGQDPTQAEQTVSGHSGLARHHPGRLLDRVRSILLVPHSVFSSAARVSSGD